MTRTAALDYARQGFLILPIWGMRDGRCGCDRPYCGQTTGRHLFERLARHDYRDATSDPDVIRTWYDHYPEVNIGLATGRVPGIFALGVNPRGGGDVMLACLENALGRLPATWTVLTGPWNRYFCFRYPNTGVVSSRYFEPGLAIRSDREYVVAPPSMHFSGRRYMWQEGRDPASVELADAPRWLTDLMTVMGSGCRPNVDPLADQRPAGWQYRRRLEIETNRVENALTGTCREALDKAAFRLGLLVADGRLKEVDVGVGLAFSTRFTDISIDERHERIRSGIEAAKARKDQREAERQRARDS